MHIHILGICGTFMGGLAALAREAGHRVTGCDENVYPPMSDQLRSLGIELIEGWSPDQLKLAPDEYVVGNVVKRGNPLFEAVLDAGARYTSGPQWLAEHVLQGRHVLAVAGTHGKTTTTSMLAWVLEQAGLEPGFLVGGVPVNFGVSARLGRGRSFVIEADEYDTALFDKRSKFVHYRPRTAILNNLEHDHADIFPDLAAIETQFHHLVRTVPSSGRLVVNARDEALQRVLQRGCWSEVQRFGARREEPGVLRARGEPHAFDVLRGSMRIGRVEWACWASTTSSTHWPPSPRPNTWACRPSRPARRWPASPTCAAGSSCAARPAACACTTTSPTTPPPCGSRWRACGASSNSRARRAAPPAAGAGGVRAPLQHDEARHDEGPAALGAGSRPIAAFCLQGDYGWSAGMRWRRWRARPWWPTAWMRWWPPWCARPGPATTWCA